MEMEIDIPQLVKNTSQIFKEAIAKLPYISNNKWGALSTFLDQWDTRYDIEKVQTEIIPELIQIQNLWTRVPNSQTALQEIQTVIQKLEGMGMGGRAGCTRVPPIFSKRRHG